MQFLITACALVTIAAAVWLGYEIYSAWGARPATVTRLDYYGTGAVFTVVAFCLAITGLWAIFAALLS